MSYLHATLLILMLALVSACSGPPRPLATAAASKDAPVLWPGDGDWRGQGSITITWPGQKLQARIHILTMGGRSTRIVISDQDGEMIDDTILTVGEGHSSRAEPKGLLDPMRHSLRHAILPVREDKTLETRRDGLLQRRTGEGSFRIYAPDPHLLRQAHGHWGWVEVSDYRLVLGHLLPHALKGRGGVRRWQAEIDEWTAIEPVSE